MFVCWPAQAMTVVTTEVRVHAVRMLLGSAERPLWMH